MRVSWILFALWLATVSRCDEPAQHSNEPDPKPGDYVHMRGTLAEDVDCRLLRADSGKTYSLSSRLRGWANGSKVCLFGTVAEATQCMASPMIEVQSVKPLSSCP